VSGPLSDLGRVAYDNARAKGFYDVPPSIAERLCLVHSEVSEALEAHRDGDDALRFAENGKPEGLPSELADVVIRVLDMATHLGIDMDHAVSTKMAYNASRPRMHGGKRL
jgi:NTP pyrophosphatase (non-canonical NTP hydrolase)